jgi:dolichyl-phosphate-mannose--protein O-mannosyl transferase
MGRTTTEVDWAAWHGSENGLGRRAAHARPLGWQRFFGFISKPLFVFIAVGIIAAVPRFYQLSQPHDRVFDEIYYTKDGCLYAGYPFKECGLQAPDEQSWVHPPLGKWMIAAGIRIFGNDQFGWRVSGAFIGTLTVVLISMFAFFLWRSSLWAFIAGLLGATEALLVVQSRTALLDIFEAFWIVLAFLFLVLDKAWIERRTPVVVPERRPDMEYAGPVEVWPGDDVGWRYGPSPWLAWPIPTTNFVPPPEPGGGTAAVLPPFPEAGAKALPARERKRRIPSPFWRPWRVATGVAFGCALGVKWSAVAAIAGAMLLSIFWERTRRAKADVRHPFKWAVIRESFPVIVSLLLLPIVVYGATFVGRIQKDDYPPYRYRPGFSYSWILHPSRFGDLHWQIGNFHHGLLAESKDPKTGKVTPAHPYESRPWTWFALGRPVAYFYKASKEGTTQERRREVLGVGSPAIFWFAFITIPWLAVMWRRRRDWKAGLIFVAIMSQYVFWFIPDISLQKVQFFFYATPIAPFLVLASTYVVRDLAQMRLAGSRSRPFLPVAVAYVVIAVLVFWWLWPVLSAQPLTPHQWAIRMLFPSWI